MYLVSPRRCCYEGADLTFLFFADRNHFFSLATVLQKKKKAFSLKYRFNTHFSTCSAPVLKGNTVLKTL